MVLTGVCSRAQVTREILQGPPAGRPTLKHAFLGLVGIPTALSPLSPKRLFPSPSGDGTRFFIGIVSIESPTAC